MLVLAPVSLRPPGLLSLVSSHMPESARASSELHFYCEYEPKIMQMFDMVTQLDVKKSHHLYICTHIHLISV